MSGSDSRRLSTLKARSCAGAFLGTYGAGNRRFPAKIEL